MTTLSNEFQGIANYGIFWEREKVNWWPGSGRRGRPRLDQAPIRLLGQEQVPARQHIDRIKNAVDFANQRGVYLLHHGLEVMYVGLTVASGNNNGLFYRLRWHHNDPTKSPLWDRFSWFGFRPVENGTLKNIPTDMDQPIPMSALVRVVETVLIQACMPKLNGQAGQLLGTIYGQVRDPALDENQETDGEEQSPETSCAHNTE